MFFIVKIILSAILIAASTEIAKRNPSIGGMILAMPLVSLVAFGLMGYQGTSPGGLADYAKSTLIFVPLSLVFFLPFVIPFSQNWGFIPKYLVGITALIVINLVAVKLKWIEL